MHIRNRALCYSGLLTLFLVSCPAVCKAIKFTYLDEIDDSIPFAKTFYINKVDVEGEDGQESFSYSIVTPPSADSNALPGYLGKRCIIDIEIALRLSKIQTQLKEKGMSLKVFDAYRPQKAVDYTKIWRLAPEDPIVKKYHHPLVNKIDFRELSYQAEKSSHTRGVAVDLTIVELQPALKRKRPQDFLGIWDPNEIDVGNVGFLAFDSRSGHDYKEHTTEQEANRQFLRETMWSQGFQKLRSEFWHYFYQKERNTDFYYDFDIKDGYLVREDHTIVIPQ